MMSSKSPSKRIDYASYDNRVKKREIFFKSDNRNRSNPRNVSVKKVQVSRPR